MQDTRDTVSVNFNLKKEQIYELSRTLFVANTDFIFNHTHQRGAQDKVIKDVNNARKMAQKENRYQCEVELDRHVRSLLAKYRSLYKREDNAHNQDG